MLMPRVWVALIWVLAAAAVFSMCAVWIVDAHSGMVGAWTLLAFFWSAALLSVLGHYLVKWRDPVARYLARRKPLAGPRRGAQLPR
ncbi:MAG: hypothetical protein K2X43_07645 [Hyphomonadaceae bacterium]|nr:hypothetical protein [Hyphomonadaceae bacterium]